MGVPDDSASCDFRQKVRLPSRNKAQPCVPCSHQFIPNKLEGSTGPESASFFYSNLIYLRGKRREEEFPPLPAQPRLDDLQLRPALFLFQDLLPLRLAEREKKLSRACVAGRWGGKKNE